VYPQVVLLGEDFATLEAVAAKLGLQVLHVAVILVAGGRWQLESFPGELHWIWKVYIRVFSHLTWLNSSR
jgi:hypothetical protein